MLRFCLTVFCKRTINRYLLDQDFGLISAFSGTGLQVNDLLGWAELAPGPWLCGRIPIYQVGLSGGALHIMMHDLYMALRRLQRATEIHAKRLGRHSGLTPIQLLILHSIQATGEGTLGTLAKQVSVSQATLSTIIDRLESRELLKRVRSQSDKRKVHLCLTDKGEAVIQAEPALLPAPFLESFGRLADWEQLMLLASLQRVAGLFEEGHQPSILMDDEPLV